MYTYVLPTCFIHMQTLYYRLVSALTFQACLLLKTVGSHMNTYRRSCGWLCMGTYTTQMNIYATTYMDTYVYTHPRTHMHAHLPKSKSMTSQRLCCLPPQVTRLQLAAFHSLLSYISHTTTPKHHGKELH